MARIRKARATVAARTRQLAAARQDFPMHLDDTEYEEESWLESEAQVTRFLGDFSSESDWIATD